MTSFFGFAAAPVDVEIHFDGEEARKQVEIKGDKEKKELCPVYYDGESVGGQVSSSLLAALLLLYIEQRQVLVRVKDGKKFQHDGIRIELVGSIGRSSAVSRPADKLCLELI